ncbi:MAG TPA: cysteine-rich small domain-containing protein [Methanoregulaceae archaeon]|nr:cysteine-rich small domain-containing protein [Methanoregulaceae archaeon]
MKYYLRNNTLFIRGLFRAASTGPLGGIGEVPTLLLCSVREISGLTDEQVIENRVYAEGLSRECFGLVTETTIENLCILQYDFISVFILERTTESGRASGTVHIIIYSGEGLSDAALLSAIITGTEAKSETLLKAGRGSSGSAGDMMIIASEGTVAHHGADPGTDVGKRIGECIRFGMSRASGETRPGNRPALYVFSRFGEGHFAEWTPEHCPYYPCHFEGQRCDYCYCPFYPCGDEELGQYVEGSNGRRVWNCSRCVLLHKPEIADYLRRNPEASLKEIKKLDKSPKTKL